MCWRAILLCGQGQNLADLEMCKITKRPTNEFSGSPTVCISGVSPRTNFRNGIRTSRGQSRFNVSGAKRPLDAVLGRFYKTVWNLNLIFSLITTYYATHYMVG